MSQAGIVNLADVPLPPDVPTSFVENTGTAVPAGGVLNILGTGGTTTSGAGSTVTVNSPVVPSFPLSPTNGGTGVSNPTAHTLPVAEGASNFNFLGPLTNGQLLIGSTGADPSAANITSTGGTINVTNGAGTINLEVATGGLAWVDVTTFTQNLAVETGYVTNRSGGVSYTLPATAILGNEIAIVGKSGSWSIAQGASQQILLGSASTTVGFVGAISSTNVGDCVNLICITAGASTVWRVNSSMGNITVV